MNLFPGTADQYQKLGDPSQVENCGLIPVSSVVQSVSLGAESRGACLLFIALVVDWCLLQGDMRGCAAAAPVPAAQEGGRARALLWVAVVLAGVASLSCQRPVGGFAAHDAQRLGGLPEKLTAGSAALRRSPAD
jgi:hypothetical protein